MYKLLIWDYNRDWCLYFTRDLTSATFCVIGNEICIFNGHAIGLSGFGQCSRDLLWTPTDLIKFLMQQTANFCCSCLSMFCCSVPVMHLITSNTQGQLRKFIRKWWWWGGGCLLLFLLFSVKMLVAFCSGGVSQSHRVWRGGVSQLNTASSELVLWFYQTLALIIWKSSSNGVNKVFEQQMTEICV